MVQLAYCIYAWRLRRLYMVIFVCRNSCWIYGVAEIVLESTDNKLLPLYNIWLNKKYGKDLESREQLLDSDRGSTGVPLVPGRIICSTVPTRRQRKLCVDSL
jgi:hypothetical protein